MKILITPFQIATNDGGGWVSRKIYQWHAFSHSRIRSGSFWGKALCAVKGVFCLPFLHPIFTRYVPFLFLLKNRPNQIWLNFSQTFGAALFVRNSVLVCHDLQCHRRFRLKRWVRWSERLLLNRAAVVQVLSSRDQKLVHRYYGVPLSRIVNIGPRLMDEVQPFGRDIAGPLKRVIFLGTLARAENHEGMAWFVEHVLPHCQELEVLLIGAVDSRFTIRHPQLKYLGFVDDLGAAFAHADLMIAPMFSDAGIKIKVIEALMKKMPVLGTRSAYSGLPMPSKGFCSNEASAWVALLNGGGRFVFHVAPNDDLVRFAVV